MPTPLQTIKDHYAASDRGDIEGMLAPFAPDIRWTEMAGFPYAGTFIGPEAVRANVFNRLAQDWDGYRADPELYVSDGDQVVAFGTYSGTFQATGKHMRARFVHHWQLADGQVVRFEQYTDTAVVRAAMEQE